MNGYCVSDKYCRYKSDTGYCGYTAGCALDNNSAIIEAPKTPNWSITKVVDISTDSIEAITEAVAEAVAKKFVADVPDTNVGDTISRLSLKQSIVASLILGGEKTLDQIIDEEPTIDAVQVKHGRWKGYDADEIGWTRDDGTPVFLVCSVCNGVVLNNGSAHWNYCPNCGADMREREES